MRIAVFFAIAATIVAQSYTVTPLAVPNGAVFANPFAINNFGQVAETIFYGSHQGQNQAYIGSVSGSTPIPLPSGYASSSGFAINNFGQVAGTTAASTQSPLQPFIGTTAGSSLVKPPPGWINDPSCYPGLSDSGFAAETGGNQTTSQAFIATASGSRPIPLLAGWSYSGACAVNNLGQVAGFVSNGSTLNAFIGNASGSALIPLPSGWTITAQMEPYAINDYGQVAGVIWTGNGSQQQAFVGTAEASFVIPLPPGATFTDMNAQCINNSGMVVGTSDAGGWIWSPSTGTVPINSLVSGWNVNAAFSISDNGHILGQASQTGAPSTETPPYVDLFPIGPPSQATPSSPTNGFASASLTPTLSWSTALGATSYDVYIGTSPIPPFVANVTAGSYVPPALASNTTYYWRVAAKNSSGSTISPIYGFTTLNPACSFSASPTPVSLSYQGGSQSVSVTTGAACAWTPASSTPWLTYPSNLVVGTESITLSAGSNAGSAQLGYINFANQTVGVMQGGSPSAPIFNDVPSTDPYFDYVSLMSTYGITAGCQSSPALYCPSEPVTRAQMAVFIVVGLDLAMGTSLTYSPNAYFEDVPSSGVPDSEYFPFVQRLAQLKITAGCQTSPALFCPDEPIPQGQMAVFVISVWMMANNITTLTYPMTPYFSDVPSTDIYFPFVQKMAQLGFWMGCGGGAYCETSSVTRDQMAPMILRGMFAAP